MPSQDPSLRSGLASLGPGYKIIFFVFALFFLDRFLKFIAWQKISALSGGDFFVISKFFKFTFFANRAGAFGLPFGADFIIATSAAIIVFLILSAIRALLLRRAALSVGLVLIILGAVSNLFDRLIYQFVIDYLYLWPMSYFNLADVMIGGGILLVFLNVKSRTGGGR